MRFRRIASLIFLFLQMTVAAQEGVPYPSGYRSWTHVKSMLINQGHPLYDAFGGIHHVYANERERAGYKNGRFADGSIIVLDLLAAKEGGSAVQEGERKVVGVMHRNTTKYKTTGGWGFEAFKGDGGERVVGAKAAEACYACHTAQKDHNFIFSAWRK